MEWKHQTPSTLILRPETDAGEDVGELAFGTRVREDGIDFEVHQADVAFLNGWFQPLERLLVIAESGVDRRHRVRRDVALTLQLLQVREHRSEEHTSELQPRGL